MNPQEIQDFIRLFQRLAIEFLQQRGLTEQQLIDARKAMTEQLLSDIDSELAKYKPSTPIV